MTPKSHRKGPSAAEYKEYAAKNKAAAVRRNIEVLAKDFAAMGDAMNDHGHLAGWETLENAGLALALLGSAIRAAQAKCPRPEIGDEALPRTL